MDLFDKPSYSEDSYAAKFLNGVTVFPSDARIFHQVGYEYDDVVAPGRVTFDGQVLKMNLTYLSGAPGVLSIEPVMPGVLRIKVGAPGAKFDETSPMLVPFSEERPGASFEDLGSTCAYTFCDYRLEIARSPFCLRVIDPKGAVIFESETEELVGLPTAPPLGLRRRAIGSGAGGGGAISNEAWAFLSWRMRNGERFFGLGERFTRFEKTGTRATIWSADTCGSNTTDMSYKAVPVLFSTAGWALMLHSSYRSYWEIGSFSYATGGMMVEDEKLDLFLILAPELKQQVVAYTALTGRPAMPPRWSFGLWMSRAAYNNREQMLEVANRLRAEQIPCDVFNIDPSWMEHGYYNDIGVEVCNFNWNAPAWGDPEPLFKEFDDLGYAICLWINPYFSEDSPAYAEAKQKGYLVKTTAGGIARLEFGLAAGIIDFTNPQAKAWWQSKLVDLLRKGAAVFKVDFGDRVPENALFANGRTGREMHNLFVHLYAQAVFEATAQVKGEGVVWRRPGYIGTQRYPGCWAGDTQVTWEGMAGALRGGLSAAFTGDSFWSHDIGGFVGQKPPDELYIRWVQFGMLSPFSRFHGTTPREPWFYGDPAMEVVRHYAQLRYALMPYLLAYGRESADTGLPLLRPMVLEFPKEPRIDTIDDQYLLGPDLLVAPVMQPGARSRVIYLPKGQWWSFDRPGVVLTGPGYREVEAPLERVPLYVRAGALIPHYRHVPQHLKGPAPKEWGIDIYPGDGHRHLVIGEPGYTVKIDYTNEGGTGKLEVSPAPVTLAVRLVDRRPTFLRAGEGTRLQPGDQIITFILDATPGASVTFKA
jgi:alpha-D-xyloside xylohydrolase